MGRIWGLTEADVTGLVIDQLKEGQEAARAVPDLRLGDGHWTSSRRSGAEWGHFRKMGVLSGRGPQKTMQGPEAQGLVFSRQDLQEVNTHRPQEMWSWVSVATRSRSSQWRRPGWGPRSLSSEWSRRSPSEGLSQEWSVRKGIRRRAPRRWGQGEKTVLHGRCFEEGRRGLREKGFQPRQGLTCSLPPWWPCPSPICHSCFHLSSALSWSQVGRLTFQASDVTGVDKVTKYVLKIFLNIICILGKRGNSLFVCYSTSDGGVGHMRVVFRRRMWTREELGCRSFYRWHKALGESTGAGGGGTWMGTREEDQGQTSILLINRRSGNGGKAAKET